MSNGHRVPLFRTRFFTSWLTPWQLKQEHKVCILPAMSICIKYTILRFLKGCPCSLAFWHYTSLKCAGAFKVYGVFIFWRAVHKIYLTSLTWKAHAHLLWPFCDSNYQHNEHATRQQVFNSKSTWTQVNSPQNKGFCLLLIDHFRSLHWVGNGSNYFLVHRRLLAPY